MHEYNGKRHDHWFFIPYKITVRRDAHVPLNTQTWCFNALGVLGHAFSTQQTTGAILASLDLRFPTVVMACSEPRHWFRSGTQEEHSGCRDPLEDDFFSQSGGNTRQARNQQTEWYAIDAGPCTGESKWARLNKSRGPDTKQTIEKT